jgi:TonB-linked SusC/RagA family outer membrane protein
MIQNHYKPLLILFACILSVFAAFAQSRTITGMVSDDKGSPLSGATVSLKNSNVVTTTNTAGIFTINVPSGAHTLAISFVGMTTKEVVLGNSNKVSVTLEPTTNTLNDVVVIGYGSKRRAEVTSSIASISEKDIKNLPVSGADQALQGKAAGVSVSTNGGQPGGGVSVRVRGITSVNGNEPLYVVDGVPLAFGSNINYSAGGAGAAQTVESPLSTINPSDIASIDILKDASAQAIYGSRAANGVVIITTKKGKTGEGKISYDAYYGQQSIQKKLPMMDLSQFAQYSNEVLQEIATVNGNTYIPIGEYREPSLLGKGTDWQDALFQTGHIQNHQLAFSGGANKTTYYSSLNYFDQQGTVIGSGLKRYSLRLNLEQQVKSWLKVGITSSLSRTNQNVSLTNGAATPISVAVTNSPAAPIYKAGQFAPAVQVGGYFFGSNQNPIALASLRDISAIQSKALTNIYGEFTFNNYLSFKTEFGFDFSLSQSTFYQPQVFNGNISIIPQSKINEDRGTGLFFNVTNYANYDQHFGKHHVMAQIGQEAWESNYDDVNGSRLDLNLNFQSIGAGSAVGQTAGGGKYSSAMSSYFSRLGYTFDERYSLNLSLRRDGSSTFGPDKRIGYFPAASLGWTVTNETFAKNLKTLSYLKLRLGAGAVGNTTGGGSNAFTSGLSQHTGAFGAGSWPSNVPNPQLHWESVVTYNGGIDASVLNRKVDLTVDVYKKVTTGMLLTTNLPWYTGIGLEWYGIQSSKANSGEMTNTGIDISATTYNINKKDFRWKTTAIFSHYKNILNKLNEGAAAINVSATDALNADRIVTRTVPGQPVGQFYGFVVDGLFHSEAEINSSANQGLTVTPKGTWLGDVKYNDISGPNGKPDGVIDGYDQTFIGNPNPKFTFGLTNTFSYQNFDFSFFIQGSYGADILNFTKLMTEGLYNVYNNQSTGVLNRYTASNPNGNLPRYNEWHKNNLLLSNRFVEDGSYARLQTVSLGYNLPERIIRKAKMSAARIYILGQNLYTLTSYSGFDPELGSFNQNALYTNIDNGNYPNPRSITVGVNITF